MQVLHNGAFVPARPMGVYQHSTWTPAQTIFVLSAGAWKQVWPDAAPPEPQELYAVEVAYRPNYVVDFTAKKGFVPEGDAAGDEAFMFRCVQMPKDGYVGRTFTKQWSMNGYGGLDCTLEDLYGDGTAGANNGTRISFRIYPSSSGDSQLEV